MNKFYAPFLYLLLGINCYSQTAINKTDLPPHILLIPVQTNGIKLFVKKYRSASIAYNKNTQELLLYGDVNDKEVIFLEKIKHQFTFYPENLLDCIYIPEKGISLCSSVPGKTEIICGIFSWKNESAFYEKEERSDVSTGIKLRAEKLIQLQKPYEALLAYDSLIFPTAYINVEEVAVKLLMSAQIIAQEEATKRKFKEASAIIQSIFNYSGWNWLNAIKTDIQLKSKFGKSLYGLSLDQFSEILSTHLQHVNDARQYDQTLENVYTYIKWFPQKADWWRILGDAYYAKKEKEKAKENYNIYIFKMKELKKVKQIPVYIEQRL